MTLPDRKVMAGGIAGLVTWALCQVAAHYGVVLDPSMVTLLTGVVGTAMAWVVPPAQRDLVKRLNDELVAIAAADPSVPVDPTTKPAVKK